jgi:hypothetical protein
MMPIKYIGKTFAEEVEILIGTLCNLPFDYIRYDGSPYILHFISEQEAQAALKHLNHFIFSCFLAEPVIDGKNITFARCPHSPIVLSPSFRRKRDTYIRKLFHSQIKNLERMLRADERVYHRRGSVFAFADACGVATALECLTLDPSPSSPFGYGLLDYVQPEPLRIEVVCRKDVPYG